MTPPLTSGDQTARHGRLSPIRFATLCSGIEAPSVSFSIGDFEPVFFSEIARYPSRLLAHHYPAVPNLGDVTEIRGGEWRGKVDVLWASTPCQSFSKAGARQGLGDERGRLTLKAAELINSINPPVFCWENVKGVLSDRQNAFGDFISHIIGLPEPLLPPGWRWERNGYVVGRRRTLAWRVLDAAHGGLAARRERVFLVGCDRESGIDAADILFERFEGSAGAQARWAPQKRKAAAGEHQDGAEATVWFNCDTSPKHISERAGTLRAAGGSGGASYVFHKGEVHSLDARCREALMGFPLGYTDVPGASETTRCAALGNSVAITDCRWIGERIAAAWSAARSTSKRKIAPILLSASMAS